MVASDPTPRISLNTIEGTEWLSLRLQVSPTSTNSHHDICLPQWPNLCALIQHRQGIRRYNDYRERPNFLRRFLENAQVPTDATVIDLEDRVVVPSFIDSHVHILQYGQSLRKVDLIACTSLDQIRETIKSYAESHPSVPRILCRGWIQSSTNGVALASMLDDLDPRPIYIDAFDLHSMWCNSAGLEEMKAHTAPDLPGGTIHRDENGQASGLLDESVLINLAWPHLESLYSKKDQLSALDVAVSTYTAAGYTGIVDMAMDEGTWDILQEYRRDKTIPFHIGAHWLVPFSDDQQANFTYVDRAIELRKQFPNPSFTVLGIKLICDGVVDGCTAALLQPYMANQIQWTQSGLRTCFRVSSSVPIQPVSNALSMQLVTRLSTKQLMSYQKLVLRAGDIESNILN